MRISLVLGYGIAWNVQDGSSMKALSPNTNLQRFINEGLLSQWPALICRLKQLDQGIYTQKDAEAAIGLSTDRGTVTEKMDTR